MNGSQMTPDKLGLKLLRALKREKDSGKSLLDCRPISAVATELKFTDSQRKAALGFLIEKQAIKAVTRSDGMAALSSPVGDALLAAREEKTAWTIDRRLTLYSIIISLILALVGLVRCTTR
jgi:predicted P-loop ATPase/GTPase